jgi:exodeoxyribonuclease V beta subunit
VNRLDVLACPLRGRQLIEASAGTGKTWAICALYLRLLLAQQRTVQQILVVTFTNAATAELRERIRGRLAEALAQLQGTPPGADPLVPNLLALLRSDRHTDSTLAERLQLALHSFDEAAIFTIHGFCQRALGDSAFTAQMPLQLELLTDDSELRQAVVNDFWRQAVAGADLPPALVAHLLARKDSPQRWAALLKRQLSRPMADVRWPAVLDAPTPAADTAAVVAAFEAAQALWAAQRPAIVQLLADAVAAKRLHGSTYKADGVADGAADWDALLAAGQPLVAVPKKALLYTAALLQAKTNGADKGKPTPAHPFFDAAQALADAQAALQAALQLARLQLLRRLLTEAPAALAQAKRDRRVVAFDDMLANLHQRLQADGGAALAAGLRQRYPAALIDEFQDTDPLQYRILDTIYPATDADAAAATPLFFVGDPKQAIYSFRNADLPTYLAARASTAAVWTLADNQRSVPALIDALNTLFTQQAQPLMQPGLDYVRVGPGQKPRPVLADGSGGPTAALQLWRLPVDDDGAPLPKRVLQQRVVQATAAEIARLIAAGRAGQLQLGDAPLAAGDIAVLVRSHRQGSAVRQALAALGVGSVELSQASVFQSSDAQDLATVLAAVLAPTRVPLLKAALATPLLGWNAAQLLALADDEAALQQRMQALVDWKAVWQRSGVGSALRRLMADEAVAQRLILRPDGERRLTNLLHLAELLHQAATQHPAPEALLRWLQAQQADGRSDDASQLRLESDRHLVQIITIHKSKGLEYGVVFCPFLWDGGAGGRAEAMDGTVWHDGTQAVVDFRGALSDEVAQDEGYDKDEVTRRQRQEAAAEQLRLVYVALTRAVQRLVLVAGCYQASAGRGTSTSESQRSVLNWLVAGGGHTPADWLHGKPPPASVAEIDQAWDALDEAGGSAIATQPVPAGAGVPLPPQASDSADLAALPPPRSVAPAWRIGSYSGLVHGAVHEPAAQDHDRRQLADADADGHGEGHAADDSTPADSRTVATTAAATDPDDILQFPRGPAAGDALHAVFESVDFTAPGDWPAKVAQALRPHAAALPGADDPATAERHQRQLLRALADVLATPLTAGDGGAPPLRLDTVPLAHRLTELAFHLPAPHVASDALNHLLARHGYAGPLLTGGGLRGYLKGFIDAVVRHAGRWYVIDWKSNHLGHTPADYGPGPLAAAMAREGYHLQHLLYSVALLRWLRRVQAEFDPAQHFGGVRYLFVRGVRPLWRNADGSPCGVFAHRPSDAVLAELSALLDGQDPLR